MEWNITGGRPVYLQLIEQLKRAVVTGEYPAGSRMPPVRELAADAGVNPNTMQRALQELESSGLLQTQRTAGRSVTADTDLLNSLRNEQAAALAEAFLRDVRRLGLSNDEIKALLLGQAEQTKEETDGTNL